MNFATKSTLWQRHTVKKTKRVIYVDWDGVRVGVGVGFVHSEPYP